MPGPAAPHLIHNRDQTRWTTKMSGELSEVRSRGNISSLQHSSQWLQCFVGNVKIKFSSNHLLTPFPLLRRGNPRHRCDYHHPAPNVFFLGAISARRYTLSYMAATHRAQHRSVLETILYLQGYFRQRLLPLRISPMQAAILFHLERHPNCHLVELASAFYLQPESMGANVSVVLRRGWAYKTRTNENRRIVQLTLTASGKSLLRRVKQTLRSAKVKSPSLKLRTAA